MATTAATAKFKRVTGDGEVQSRSERAASTVKADHQPLTAEELSKLGELTPDASIGWVDIDAVFPMGGEETILDGRDGRDRGQPRKYFDPEKLQILADNIKIHGQQTPCIVRRVPSRHASRKWEYGLVSGERRWQAKKNILGDKTILVKVQDLDKRRSFRQAMIDELTSEKFTPTERSGGLLRVFKEMEEELAEYLEGAGLAGVETAWKDVHYDRLKREWKNEIPMHIAAIAERAISTKRVPKVIWEDVADVYGLSRRSIYSYTGLTKLPQYIRNAVDGGKITMSHADSLLTLGNEIDRRNLYNEILRENLSSARTAEAAKKLLGKQGPQRIDNLATHMKSIVSRFEKAADAPLPESKEERNELRETARAMREFAEKIEAQLADE